MTRKRWQAQTQITPELLRSRERRKWQIALRRYVIERNRSTFYAPYFGLDIENLRKWFECQFTGELSWENFGKAWQFEHIIPVTYFDFAEEKELKMCWNFTNLRVDLLEEDRERTIRTDITAARNYFRALYERTQYEPCKAMLDKITGIEQSDPISSAQQESFIINQRDYLRQIEDYSSFEFELLNSGRSISEVEKEIDFLKKHSD